MEPLLTVENLYVRFTSHHRVVDAVRGLSFTMGREKLGIVGESGSGKSVAARAILGLVRSPGKVEAEKLVFDGQDLLVADSATWRSIRGSRIAMVMQDPKFSLNPVMKVGKQIVEACRAHRAISRGHAKEQALAMLRAVQIRDADRVFHQYPHQVSGGMGQRIMIAMMLITNPDLLIADEPTSALDVNVQLQLLAIMDDLVSQQGMGLIFISHDLHLVASFCDRVIIMYGGQVMEVCDAGDLHNATHPYTRGLLSCMPSIDRKQPVLPVLQRQEAWLKKML